MVFPLTDYRSCLFHRDEAKLLKHENDGSATIFPCCGQPVKVFESIKSNSGCEYRDHLIDETYVANVKDRDDANTVVVNIINDVNEMKDIICTKKVVDLTDQNSLYSLDNTLKSRLTPRLTPDTVPHQIFSKDERKRTAHHKASVSHKHSIGRKTTGKQIFRWWRFRLRGTWDSSDLHSAERQQKFKENLEFGFTVPVEPGYAEGAWFDSYGWIDAAAYNSNDEVRHVCETKSFMRNFPQTRNEKETCYSKYINSSIIQWTSCYAEN